MEFGGENDEYLIAAGLTGGGVSAFERVQGGANLTLLANVEGSQVFNRSTFVWL